MINAKMIHESNKNICKSTPTLEDYLNSCPSSFLPIQKHYPLNQKHCKLKTYSTAPHGFLDAREAFKSAALLTHIKNYLKDSGHLDLITHPEEMLLRNGKRFLDKKNVVEKDLIKFFHSVWLTNEDDPQEIKSLDNFLDQVKKLENYEAIIWTNLDPDVLYSQNPLLEINKIKVNYIGDLNTRYKELLDLIVNKNNYIDLYFSAGAFIDIAKYLILQSEGGILADFNFKFSDQFSHSILAKYDFIGLEQAYNYLENGFFVLNQKSHIIMNELLNIINELVFSPDCGLKEFREAFFDCSGDDPSTKYITMMTLSMMHMKYNNQGDNLDVLISNKVGNLDKFVSASKSYLNNINSLNNNIDALYSNDLEDINNFIEKYFSLVLQQSEFCHTYNYISPDLLGEDGSSLDWGTF